MADLSYMSAGQPLPTLRQFTSNTGISPTFTVGCSAILVLRTSQARTPTVTAGQLIHAGSSGDGLNHFFYSRYITEFNQSISLGAAVGGSFSEFSINPFGLPPGTVAESDIGVGVTAISDDATTVASITPAQNNATIFCVTGGIISFLPTNPPSGYQWVDGAAPSTGQRMYVSATKQDAAVATGSVVMGQTADHMQIAFWPTNGTYPTNLITPLKAIGDTGSVVLGTLYRWIRSGGAWFQAGSETTQIPNWLNQPINLSLTESDNAIGHVAGGAGTIEAQMGLSNMPSDFLSMDTLTIRYSSALVGTITDDFADLGVAVWTAGKGVVIAADTSSPPKYLDAFGAGTWTSGSRTPPAYNKVQSFGYIRPGTTKAEWDSAVVVISSAASTSMSADGATLILTDFQLEGTYTLNIAPPSAVTDLAGTAGAGQVSLTWSAPASDGGSPITDYIVQRREVG